MNPALKQSMIAMATAALSMTAACKGETGPAASEATTDAKEADGSPGAAEGSCGEGKCGEGGCGGGGGSGGAADSR